MSSERSQSLNSDVNVSVILPEVDEMAEEAYDSSYMKLGKDIIKKDATHQSLTKVHSLGDLPNLLSKEKENRFGKQKSKI